MTVSVENLEAFNFIRLYETSSRPDGEEANSGFYLFLDSEEIVQWHVGSDGGNLVFPRAHTPVCPAVCDEVDAASKKASSKLGPELHTSCVVGAERPDILRR